MCGRYSVLTEDEIIEIRGILKELSLALVKDDFERYEKMEGEVLPTDQAPVITKNTAGISFESAKWGFQRWNGSGVIINARCESIQIKSTFSKLVEAGRCVVPAAQFFEWEKKEKRKIKHYAKDRDGNLLFMAGLYRDIKADAADLNETPDGNEFIREFVIITKQATGEMATIHDRIPVILRVDQMEAWLSGKMNPDDLETLDYDISVLPCEDEDNGQASLFTD